jgi:hypothetical protein
MTSSDLLADLAERSAVEPFRGFRCWSPGEVGEIMHREAAAPSRPVLLATHQPPKIRRVTVTDAGRFGADDLVAQESVLQAVMTADDQSLIVPIIGVSGTGKSHLVLWMRAKLEEQASPNRKIIYLPKGETSLSGVIDRLLDGRTGGAFDQIRDAVGKATRAMTDAEAARRLRDELSLAASSIDVASAGPAREQVRRFVRDNIANLLDDPAYSEQLRGEGGPLRRIVEQARSGGSEEPAELKAADLDVNLTEREVERLSVPAKSFLRDLKTPVLHEEALVVLNEVRDRCLSRVFGVEPMQLVGVMRQLRERLYEENRNLEIVLMVEDFTLLQGIQHDLLEAMIELPTREGRQVLCGMKTVMAVTEGFFNRMLASSDTLRTRIAAQGHVYNLDVPYGADTSSALGQETLVEFAGRYLNAVRVGSSGLDAASPTVPNACERCRHRDRCHDAFGTSGDEDFGLYPFNAAALDRMVRSRQATFNPRDLLSVLTQTLTTHLQELADGRFPSRAWERRFDTRRYDRPPLPTLLLRTEEQVEALPKAEQRSVLLTFWGGAPGELKNLPPGVHEAFDIPEAPEAGVVVPAREPDQEAVPATRPKVDEIALAMQEWRDGSELGADVARVLRRVFREAITATADPEDALLSPQALREFFDQDTDIQIERARGGGRPGSGRFAVDFAATNDNAILFEGLLQAQRKRRWDFEGGHAALVAFTSRVDKEAARLRNFLEERLLERREDHNAAIAVLALSGLAAAQGSVVDARGLLVAALSLTEVMSEEMPERWRVLLNQLESRKASTREFALQSAHVSKSTTDPSGVDGSQFLPSLSRFKEGWELPELSDDAPQPVQMLRRVLEERLEPALDDAREKLAEWDAAVGPLIGDPETTGDRAKAWRAALDEAEKAGFLATAAGFSREAAPSQLAATCRIVRSLLAEWEKMDRGRRVGVVAKVPWARLGPVRQHLLGLEATLRASYEKAQTQGDVAGGASPVDKFEEALDNLAQVAAMPSEVV